jgi:hypothetical protein
LNPKSLQRVAIRIVAFALIALIVGMSILVSVPTYGAGATRTASSAAGTAQRRLTLTAIVQAVLGTPVSKTTTDAPADVDPAAFDYSKAQLYRTSNGVIEIKLPTGWKWQPPDANSPVPNQYEFLVGDPQNPTVSLIIFIDTKAAIQRLYENFFAVTFDNPKNTQDLFTQALTQLKKTIPADSGITIDDPVAVKIGGVTDGYGIAAHFTANTQAGTEAKESEYWMGTLADGRAVALVMQGSASVWKSARPTLHAMIADLVIHLNRIATATPTSTLHPLLITATALQNQILSLTPVGTITETPESSDSGEPTQTP